MAVDPAVELRPFTREQLSLVEPWFDDPDTRRFLGGPDWPARMLDLASVTVGTEFRGAVQTGSYRWLAWQVQRAVGYIDCGTFDRWTVYDGADVARPVIRSAIAGPAGAISFVVDPASRRRGLGRVMVRALLGQPELGHVRVFGAGVEPANVGSIRCLEAAGLHLSDEEPDWEGMLYFLLER